MTIDMCTCDLLARTNILILDNTLLTIDSVKPEIYLETGQASEALEPDILTHSELLEVMDHSQCRICILCSLSVVT